MLSHRVCAVALIAALLCGATVAQGAAENLLVRAACGYRAGTSTAGAHAGPTPVHLAGVAVLGAGVVIDPFYLLSADDPSVSLGLNRGRFRWVRASQSFCTCQADCPGTLDVAAAVVGAVPAFSPTHEYDVVLDFGPDPAEPIVFGADDCSCADNSGALVVAFPCATNADCDDGARCTVDVCGPNQECHHDYDPTCGVHLDDVTGGLLAPDGRFYLAGSLNLCSDSLLCSSSRLAVVRFLPDGRPDASFGSGGEIIDEFGQSAMGTVLDASGRITAIDGDFFGPLLVRYAADGSLDPTFGIRGRAAGARMQTGRIALIGEQLYEVGTDETGIVLARYRDDGMIDASFGTAGTSRPGGGFGTMFDVMPYPGRELLPLGFSCGPDGCTAAVARLTGSGDLDSGFGTGGIVVTSVASLASDPAISIQPDGSVVVSGQFSPSPTQIHSGFALERYDAMGVAVSSFGVLGRVETPLGTLESGATRLAALADGNVLAAGYDVRAFYTGPDRYELARSSLVLARYRPDGNLDPTFGFGGAVTSAFDSRLPTVLLVQADGKFIVAGAQSPFYPFFLLRYEPNGRVDQSFAAAGAICGDGVVATQNEQCDEGAENGTSTSCCTATCEFRAAGEVCRTASLTCDVPESCDGVTASCPADAFAGSETPCELQDPCTTKDHCDGGRCVSGVTVCRGSAVQAATKLGHRLPRIDVTCSINRDQVPDAANGGSCHATAFMSATKHEGTGLPVASFACTSLGDDATNCVAAHAAGMPLTREAKRKLGKQGSVTLTLKLRRAARKALRRHRAVDVDVCAAIQLSTGREIPLRCSGALQP